MLFGLSDLYLVLKSVKRCKKHQYYVNSGVFVAIRSWKFYLLFFLLLFQFFHTKSKISADMYFYAASANILIEISSVSSSWSMKEATKWSLTNYSSSFVKNFLAVWGKYLFLLWQAFTFLCLPTLPPFFIIYANS